MEIKERIKKGEVVVLPTDTVYGLICDAKNNKAIDRIFKIKKRDRNKPIAIFVKDIEMAKEFAYISKREEAILKEVWPGKTTVILNGKKELSDLLYKDGKIGMRVPDHSLIISLVEETGPLAQTSANISGENSCTIEEIKIQLREEGPDFFLDGGKLEGSPSEVVDITGKTKVIREYVK